MTIDEISIPIGTLWSLFRWLPNFILRKKFTQEILSDLIYVDLRPRHIPVRINLAESANFEIWVQVINLSPFEVELDRAEFELMCSPSLKASVLKRQAIKPGEIVHLYVSGNITDGSANNIARTIKQGHVGFAGYIDFNCKIHNFHKRIAHLEGVVPNVINEQFRIANA